MRLIFISPMRREVYLRRVRRRRQTNEQTKFALIRIYLWSERRRQEGLLIGINAHKEAPVAMATLAIFSVIIVEELCAAVVGMYRVAHQQHN